MLVVPDVVVSLSSPLVIPSNAVIQWEHTTLSPTRGSFNALVSSDTHDIVFLGSLIINGALQTGYALNFRFRNVTNFSFDAIESENAAASCLQLTDVRHVRGNSLYLHHCGYGNGSTGGDGLFINATSFGSADITLTNISVVDVNAQDGVFVCGTNCQAGQTGEISGISFGQINVSNTTDAGVEINGVSGAVLEGINASSSGTECVLVRQSTDVNIEGVTASSCHTGVYVGNFDQTDRALTRVNVSNVTCRNVNLGSLPNCIRSHRANNAGPVWHIGFSGIKSYNSGGLLFDSTSYLTLVSIDTSDWIEGQAITLHHDDHVSINGGFAVDGPPGTSGIFGYGGTRDVTIIGFDVLDDRANKTMVHGITSQDSSDHWALVGVIAHDTDFLRGGISLSGDHNTGYFESDDGKLTSVRSARTPQNKPVASNTEALPAIVNKTDLSSDLSPKDIYTIPPGGAGLYRLSCYVVLTTAATNSSSLPKCGFNYVDADTREAKAVTVTSGSPGNRSGTANYGEEPVSVAARTAVQVYTRGYLSDGSRAMLYAIHSAVESVGR